MTPEAVVAVILAVKPVDVPPRVSFDYEPDGVWRINWVGRGTSGADLGLACQAFIDALVGEAQIEVDAATAELADKQAKLSKAIAVSGVPPPVTKPPV